MSQDEDFEEEYYSSNSDMSSESEDIKIEQVEGLSKESIFSSIANSRLNPFGAKNRDDSMREEIDSISSLHKRVSDHSRVGLECLRLSK